MNANDSFKKELPWLCAALLHLIAAHFSFGYHHPDEHYQILEWARHWAGLNLDLGNLKWEYTAQIRPWFQPLIHGIFIKLASALDQFNPFIHAEVARCIYAICNVIGLRYLWLGLQNKLNLSFEVTKFAPWMLATLWFFPYMHARTSSENLSGLILTFVFGAILRRPLAMHPVLYGLGFGVAFLARYQIALGLVGLALYELWRNKSVTLVHVKLLAGFVCALLLGLVFDRIGYGTWVFTPIRYFDTNLVQGVAATFNPYPWYQYFIWILELHPFVSLPLMMGLFYFIKNITTQSGFTQSSEFTQSSDAHLLLAFCASFFVFHLMITNKEYRFLFPILNLLAPCAVIGLLSRFHQLHQKKWLSLWVIINMPAMLVSSGRIASYVFFPAYTVNRFSNLFGNSDQMWLTNHASFSNHFYTLTRPPKYETFHDDAQLKTKLESLLNQNESVWVLWDDRPNQADFESIYAVLHQQDETVSCRIFWTSIPEVVFDYRFRFPLIKTLSYQGVFICSKRVNASANTRKAASIGFVSRKSNPASINVCNGS